MSLNKSPRNRPDFWKRATKNSSDEELKRQNNEMEQAIVNHQREVSQILDSANSSERTRRNLDYLHQMNQRRPDYHTGVEEVGKESTNDQAIDDRTTFKQDTNTPTTTNAQSYSTERVSTSAYDDMMRKLARGANTQQTTTSYHTTSTTSSAYDEMMAGLVKAEARMNAQKEKTSGHTR